MRIAVALRRWRRQIPRLRELVARERRALAGNPGWRRRLALWRRGFLTESGAIYGYPDVDLRHYLSDAARYLRSPEINGRFGQVCDDKVLFHALLNGVAPLPRHFGLIIGGRFVPFAPDADAGDADGPVVSLARRHGAVVCKPRGGGGGFDVRIVRHCPDRGLTCNGKPADPRGLAPASFVRDTVVCAFVHQAAYARRIFAETANTIRVLTMIDVDTGRPFVATAVHRFGTAKSVPVDNANLGGLTAGVDLVTGRLRAAVAYADDGNLVRREAHPDSGAAIAGVEVTGLPAVRDDLLRAAAAVAFMPYVGWDVIVTDDGYSIVEGNSYTGVGLLQAHGPLLADPRVRRFYAHYGVVRG